MKITKLDYLKSVISSGQDQVGNKNWYIKAFTNPVLKEESTEGLRDLDLVIVPSGIRVFRTKEEGYELLELSDYKYGKPLFSFQEEIEIDATWLPNVKGKTKTKIGVLLINTLVISGVVGSRLEYFNKYKMSVRELESHLVSKVRDEDELTKDSVSVKELVDMIDRLNFFNSLAIFINVGATKKTITAPPGIKKIKEELLKEYEGQLKDPVKFLEFKTKLEKIDAEYLADDEAFQNSLGGKAKAGRSKMYLMQGEGLDFDVSSSNDRIMLDSLYDGLSTDPNEFSKKMNDLRFASFSRGHSTAEGGYSYKILQRSLSGIKISGDPCNTTKGLIRTLDKSQASRMYGRYIKEGSKWKLIDTIEEASKLVGKTVEIRSSMYCKSPGNTICYKCLSEGFKDLPNGTTNIAANISSVILNERMKLMHASETKSAEIKIEDLIT